MPHIVAQYPLTSFMLVGTITFILHTKDISCLILHTYQHLAYKLRNLQATHMLCTQLTLIVISRSVDLGMFRDTLICAPEASCE